MLKFILVLLFMIPLCSFLMVNYLGGSIYIFFMVFMFMMSVNLNGGIENLDYMWGFDLLSYGLILLSFWICVLMIMASASIYHSKYYSSLFIFMIIFLMLMLCAFSSSYIIFLYFFLNSCFIVNFGVEVAAWTCSGGYLSFVLYIIGFFTFID